MNIQVYNREMPTNEYIQSVVTRTARPRSKRLREAGGTIVSTSASVMGGYQQVADGHLHGNLRDLDRITVSDGYLFLTDAYSDGTQGEIVETVKAKAGYADLSGETRTGAVTLSGAGIVPVTANSGLIGDSGHRWSELWGVDADLCGDLALSQSSHIDIGPLRIEYDATSKALHITRVDPEDTNQYGIYADGIIGDGGIE